MFQFQHHHPRLATNVSISAPSPSCCFKFSSKLRGFACMNSNEHGESRCCWSSIQMFNNMESHVAVDPPSRCLTIFPYFPLCHFCYKLKPPKFEHIFIAVITFFPFLLCRYFWYQLVAYCVCFQMICECLYRHLFLEDTSKHARVTKKFINNFTRCKYGAVKSQLRMLGVAQRHLGVILATD